MGVKPLRSEFDARDFRQALGTFATGVTVVTTVKDGAVHGMTANAFTSVSLEPPLVLVSVDKRAHTHGLILSSRLFGVNILREDQEDYSRHFSGKPDPAVEARLQYEWVDGIPVLTDSLASLACRLWADYDGGDHTLFVGRVAALEIRDGNPLLFFRSAYRRVEKETARGGA